MTMGMVSINIKHALYLKLLQGCNCLTIICFIEGRFSLCSEIWSPLLPRFLTTPDKKFLILPLFFCELRKNFTSFGVILEVCTYTFCLQLAILDITPILTLRLIEHSQILCTILFVRMVKLKPFACHIGFIGIIFPL